MFLFYGQHLVGKAIFNSNQYYFCNKHGSSNSRQRSLFGEVGTEYLSRYAYLAQNNSMIYEVIINNQATRASSKNALCVGVQNTRSRLESNVEQLNSPQCRTEVH